MNPQNCKRDLHRYDPLLRQAEFLCVGCIEYTIQLADKGGLRKGGRDCFVVKERESHPTHEEKKKRILKTLLLRIVHR